MYKVLDKGWVELQDMMGDDLAIVNAARVSYLGESKGEEADKKLLFYLMKNKHHSPFEQVEFKFRIYDPEMVFRQWVRHRIASLNVQSGRYTEYDEFYVPEEWRLQDTKDKQNSDGILDKNRSVYWSDRLEKHYQLGYEIYKEALNEGIAREQARLFLGGFGVYSRFVWKVNCRSLMNFLDLRTDKHAQWEIRQYAKVIYKIFEEKLPWTAEAFQRYYIK